MPKLITHNNLCFFVHDLPVQLRQVFGSFIRTHGRLGAEIADYIDSISIVLKCFSLWNSLLTDNGIFIIEDITPSYLSDLLKKLKKHTNWKFEFINTWATRNDPVLDDSIIVKGIRRQS